jgi:hypothetical protein
MRAGGARTHKLEWGAGVPPACGDCGLMEIEKYIRYPVLAVGLMEIENLIRYTELAVGLKPLAMECEARLRGL